MAGLGRQSERVKQWRSLARREGREQTGLFLAEGPHLVQEALRGRHCRPVTLLVAEGYAGDVPAGPEVVRLAPKVFGAICDTKTPQGIAAICALPPSGSVAPGPGRWIVAEEVQDPGHVGTLARTAHAAGWTGVVLGEGSADPFSPKAVRASQGSVFHVPITRGAAGEWIADLKRAGCSVVASIVRGGEDYRSVGSRANLALLLGSEARGLSEQLAQRSDLRVSIPLPGGAESLSLPVAAGILIFGLGAPSGE